MYRSFIFIIFFIVPLLPKGQSYDLSWPLGYSGAPPQNYYSRANLNFTSGTGVIDTIIRSMHLQETNASISDSSGQLILLSNGCYISNILGDTMSNSDSLNPGSCTDTYCTQTGNIMVQGQLIVPDPNQPSRYWLFHTTCDYSTNFYLTPSKLYYSIIDMTLDSGKGSVVLKNQIAVSDTLDVGFLIATKHANGRYWWIVNHKYNSTTFIKFLLTDTGLVGPLYQSSGILLPLPNHGTTAFSPNGELIASTYYNTDISLYNFNRCTGEISFLETVDINDTIPISRVEFSASGRYLYAVVRWQIFQYDLLSSNIYNSRIVVANYDGFRSLFPTLFAYPKLAVDGRIYISAEGGGNTLHVINNPDSSGVNCQVLQHQIMLPCYNIAMPNFPNYRLTPLSIECDSTAGLDEISKADITVFPNPANFKFSLQIDVKLGEIAKLELYNIQGQLLFQTPYIQNIEIPFAAGVYYLKVKFVDGKCIIKKIIKT